MSRKLDPRVICLNLRSKEMYYESATSRSAEHDAEVERLFGAADTRQCWCQCTQTGRGPDSGVVGVKECAAAQRACFVGIDQIT